MHYQNFEGFRFGDLYFSDLEPIAKWKMPPLKKIAIQHVLLNCYLDIDKFILFRFHFRNPNMEGLPQWPEYDIHGRQYLTLNAEKISSNSAYNAKRISFWLDYLPSLLQKHPWKHQEQHFDMALRNGKSLNSMHECKIKLENFIIVRACL